MKTSSALTSCLVFMVLQGCSDPKSPCQDGFTQGDDGNCYAASGSEEGTTDSGTPFQTGNSTPGGTLTDLQVDNDGDGFSEINGDCDDSNPDVGPHKQEALTCNALDDDCNGIVDDSTSCPEDISWNLDPASASYGHAYLTIDHTRSELSFMMSFCTDLGYSPVAVADAEEWEFVLNLVRAAGSPFVDSDKYWLGLSCTYAGCGDLTSWQWYDGSAVTSVVEWDTFSPFGTYARTSNETSTGDLLLVGATATDRAFMLCEAGGKPLVGSWPN